MLLTTKAFEEFSIRNLKTIYSVFFFTVCYTMKEELQYGGKYENYYHLSKYRIFGVICYFASNSIFK